MRIFLFCLMGLMLLTSCSSDSVTYNDGNQTKVNITDLLGHYEKLLISEEYITTIGLVSNFEGKMHFDDDILLISDEKQLMDWIQSHLSQTEFSDINDARNEWGEIVNYASKMTEENSEFFSLIKDATLEEINVIVPEPDPIEIGAYGCLGDCVVTHRDCTRQNGVYTLSAVGRASSALGGGGAATVMSLTYLKRSVEGRNCDNQFYKCKDDCIKNGGA